MIPHPQKPLWKGPFVDGINQSLIIKFDECPFRAYLHAICGLRDAGKPEENLVWGDTLHKGLEYRLRGFSLAESVEVMRNYLNRKYPSSPSTYAHTTAQMLKLYPVDKTLEVTGLVDTEIKFEEYIHLHPFTSPVILKGKIDLLSKNRLYLGDHKCKGKTYPMETMRELKTDLQMNLYAYIFEVENWIYDLIAIPEDAYRCPPYNGYSNPSEYANKIFTQHYDTTYGFPIANHKDRWICQISHFQPMEEIELYFKRTIIPFIRRIIEWYDYVTSSEFDPNNPDCYNSIFYQKPIRMWDPAKTDKYKCNYYEALIEQDFSNLVTVTNMFPELTDE